MYIHVLVLYMYVLYIHTVQSRYLQSTFTYSICMYILVNPYTNTYMHIIYLIIKNFRNGIANHFEKLSYWDFGTRISKSCGLTAAYRSCSRIKAFGLWRRFFFIFASSKQNIIIMNLCVIICDGRAFLSSFFQD